MEGRVGSKSGRRGEQGARMGGGEIRNMRVESKEQAHRAMSGEQGAGVGSREQRAERV